jgi:hypothetical protein
LLWNRVVDATMLKHTNIDIAPPRLNYAHRTRCVAFIMSHPSSSSAFATPPRRSRTTAPANSASSTSYANAPVNDTPVRTSSDNLRYQNAPRPTMDRHLERELDGNVLFNVGDFIDTFFPRSEEIEQLYRYAQRSGLYTPGNDQRPGQWTAWPSSTTEREVLLFFQNVVDNQLLKQLAINTGHEIYRYVPSSQAPIKDGDCLRKTDLLLTTNIPLARNATQRDCEILFSGLGSHRYSWKSIRIVGELKSNPDESNKKSTIVQLANYVRELFGAQPCRRWVHAFTLCGQHLRAWLFDRSGAIGSALIDINADPVSFLRVVCGYPMMDAPAVGFDPSMKWSHGGVESVYDPSLAHELAEPSAAYIYVPRNTGGEGDDSPMKLEVAPSPIFKRYAIVTRGSVCWKARPYRHPDPNASSSQESIDGDDWQYVVKDQWRAAERQAETEVIAAMTQNTTASQFGLPQYVWYSDHRENGESVDILSTVRKHLQKQSSVAKTSMAPPQPPKHGKKRSASSGHASSSKRLKAIDGTRQNTSTLTSGNSCRNRIFSRVVMAPVGRSITEFTSYTELLCALRDSIRGKI